MDICPGLVISDMTAVREKTAWRHGPVRFRGEFAASQVGEKSALAFHAGLMHLV